MSRVKIVEQTGGSLNDSKHDIYNGTINCFLKEFMNLH